MRTNRYNVCFHPFRKSVQKSESWKYQLKDSLSLVLYNCHPVNCPSHAIKAIYWDDMFSYHLGLFLYFPLNCRLCFYSRGHSKTPISLCMFPFNQFQIMICQRSNIVAQSFNFMLQSHKYPERKNSSNIRQPIKMTFYETINSIKSALLNTWLKQNNPYPLHI
jgi:hypothetical protein